MFKTASQKPIKVSPRAREDEFILSCLGLYPERNHNSFTVEVCSSFRGEGSGAHNPWCPLGVHRIFSNKRPPANKHTPPWPKNQTRAPPPPSNNLPPLPHHFLLIEGMQRKAVSIATILITLCVNYKWD